MRVFVSRGYHISLLKIVLGMLVHHLKKMPNAEKDYKAIGSVVTFENVWEGLVIFVHGSTLKEEGVNSFAVVTVKNLGSSIAKIKVKKDIGEVVEPTRVVYGISGTPKNFAAADAVRLAIEDNDLNFSGRSYRMFSDSDLVVGEVNKRMEMLKEINQLRKKTTT